MLVDDLPDTLTTLARGLNKHGINVSAYSDPQLALADFKQHDYDLVILDLAMPGMNGFELAKKILVIDKNVRICILSAFDVEEVEAKKRFKGAKSIRFLKKPILPSKLAGLIETITGEGKE